MRSIAVNASLTTGRAVPAALRALRIAVPDDRLARVRLVFLAFSECSAALLLVYLLLPDGAGSHTALGASALAVLAAKWVADYRRPRRHALWALAEAGLLLLVGIAAAQPLVILLLLYARISALAVDATRARAALAAVACAGAFLGACVLAPHGPGLSAAEVFLATGFPLAATVMRMLGDILQREQALRVSIAGMSEELHRRRADRRLAALTRHTRDVIVVLDREGAVVHAAGACDGLLGVEAAALQGSAILDHVHPEDRAAARAVVADMLASTADFHPLECRAGSESSGWRDVEMVGSNLFGVDAVDGLVLTVRDVTERRRMEEELRHLAFHDALTGLPNRRVLTERAAHALQRTRGRGVRPPMVMILDLDGFKSVNDAVGHAAGDEVIATVADRIAACLRPGDTASRWGGDEFAVLLEDAGDVDEAVSVARRLIDAISQPHRVAGRSVSLSASIGVATRGEATATVGELLSDADLAMYVAKSRGRGTVQVFTPELRGAQIEQQRMQEHLAQALRRGELHVVYQPQVDVLTRRVTGAEALVRWTHPEHGDVPPDVFIPMAEQLGLVTDIDRWVMRTACADLAHWRELGHDTLRVAVNISGHDLDRGSLLDDVRATLADTGLDAWRLELELTESTAVQQADEAVRVLHELRASGVRVAIDDFGTGYSMLSRLRSLPIDRLKVDRSFVRDLSWDDDAAAIVQSTVSMGHALGLTVVAEGVESEEVMERLLGLGCDAAQGFHICTPLPADQFVSWLATTCWRAAAPAAALG